MEGGGRVWLDMSVEMCAHVWCVQVCSTGVYTCTECTVYSHCVNIGSQSSHSELVNREREWEESYVKHVADKEEQLIAT